MKNSQISTIDEYWKASILDFTNNQPLDDVFIEEILQHIQLI